MRAISFVLAITATAAFGCGDDNATKTDAPIATDDTLVDMMPDTDPGNPLTPPTLAGTGLCADASCTTITTGTGIFSYTPRYPLWSDAADKKRWVQFPTGTQIDTSNMDYWKFPIGTKVWKEFTRDNVRVETRYIVKLADEAEANAWFYVSYQWNAAQNETTAVTMGAMNANGTQHDIPSRLQCKQCHERSEGPAHDRGRLLGVSAIQLDYTSMTSADLSLQKMVDMNLLTDPPVAAGGAGTPFFPIGFTEIEKGAFGYFHANCGHCHNPTSPVHDNVPIELRLDVAHLTTGATAPTYTTTVGVTAMLSSPATTPAIPVGTLVVKPHDLANSALDIRFNAPAASFLHMPALGSEDQDAMGKTLIEAWINSLP